MARRWTESEIALLGKMTDEDIARKLGISATAVALKRKTLGIPPFGDRSRWGATELGMLGRYADKEIARITGRKLGEIQRKREALGLKEPA